MCNRAVAKLNEWYRTSLNSTFDSADDTLRDLVRMWPGKVRLGISYDERAAPPPRRVPADSANKNYTASDFSDAKDSDSPPGKKKARRIAAKTTAETEADAADAGQEVFEEPPEPPSRRRAQPSMPPPPAPTREASVQPKDDYASQSMGFDDTPPGALAFVDPPPAPDSDADDDEEEAAQDNDSQKTVLDPKFYRKGKNREGSPTHTPSPLRHVKKSNVLKTNFEMILKDLETVTRRDKAWLARPKLTTATTSVTGTTPKMTRASETTTTTTTTTNQKKETNLQYHRGRSVIVDGSDEAFELDDLRVFRSASNISKEAQDGRSVIRRELMEEFSAALVDKLDAIDHKHDLETAKSDQLVREMRLCRNRVNETLALVGNVHEVAAETMKAVQLLAAPTAKLLQRAYLIFPLEDDAAVKKYLKEDPECKYVSAR